MLIHKTLITLVMIFIFAFLNALPSVAAEAAEGAAEEGKAEEKKEAPKEEPKSTLAPWVEVETKITELQAKIKSKEANILKLLDDKKNLPNNSPQLKSTVKEIVKEHQEMRSLAADYQKNLSLLRFRFPERNVKSGRRYDRIEVKSLEEMEQAMGIDGKLNRNLKRMRSQFKSEPKTPSELSEQQALQAQPKPVKKQESIEEAGSVILQK